MTHQVQLFTFRCCKDVLKPFSLLKIIVDWSTCQTHDFKEGDYYTFLLLSLMKALYNLQIDYVNSDIQCYADIYPDIFHLNENMNQCCVCACFSKLLLSAVMWGCRKDNLKRCERLKRKRNTEEKKGSSAILHVTMGCLNPTLGHFILRHVTSK